MIPNQFLYLAGVICYLALKDGIPVVYRTITHIRKIARNRRQALEQKIKGWISEHLEK